MPFASFTKVREVSSEDNQHLAENLIKPHAGKKWKTQKVGEKSAYVVLEMDEAQKITGIDIGNEHSAFVEVLVGKSTCTSNDFQEILITCSFMTPTESRNSNNSNRVRCFNEGALVPSIAANKWCLVKIICTQPFNKHVQYGLSFIKVHVAPKPSQTVNQPPKADHAQKNAISNAENAKPIELQIGKFKLRENSPDSESDGASNLFNRWKKLKDEKCVLTTVPTSIRNPKNVDVIQASSQNSNANRCKENLEVSDRNRDALIFADKQDEIDEKKASFLSKKIEADKQRRLSEIQKLTEKKCRSLDGKRPKESDIYSHAHTLPSNSKTKPTDHDFSKKRRSGSELERPSKKEKKSTNRYKPFNELLSGVVLVISGIQNPDRSDLRSKALALGAKYKSDWDSTCTHLICAFKNTPKYNQVRGKGKIITRSWIERCYNSKMYIPWRRFALDSQELTKPESDEEVLEESLKVQNNLDLPHSSNKVDEEVVNSLALYDLDDRQPNTTVGNQTCGTSESDTDDEILRIKKRTAFRHENPDTCEEIPKQNTKNLCSKRLDDVYELSTEEEDYLHEKVKQGNIIQAQN